MKITNSSHSGYSTFSNITYEKTFPCGAGLCLSSAVVMFIVATVTTVGNSLLLLTINRNSHKPLRAASTFLIANLGVSDLLVGLLVGYTVVVRDIFRYHQLEITDYVRVFIEVIEALTIHVSGCTIIALSVDRYIAVSDPMRYRLRMTKKRIGICILLVWLSAVSLGILPMTSLSKTVYSILYLQTHGTIPILVLTVIYCQMLRVFLNHQRRVKILQRTSMAKRRDVLLQKKMTHIVCIILGLFYLTLLPAYVTFHLRYVHDAPKDQSIIIRKADFISTRFLFLNSAINPYIYAWRVLNYRRGFLRYLSFLRPKQNNRLPTLRQRAS